MPGQVGHDQVRKRDDTTPGLGDGDLSRRFSDDSILTQASLYWFTNTISTSFRPYYEYAQGMTPWVRNVTVPAAVAVFPRTSATPALAADLTEFFRPLR